jgi:DNA-binding NarL/FixJ family response regulator
MTADPPRATVRVVVQSSQRLLRDTLATCLGTLTDLVVVGKVAEPDELPSLCELARPDAVILDAGQRLSEFALLAGSLRQRYPGLNVIVTYRDASEQDLALAFRAGVTSVVPESHGLPALLVLLRRGTAPPAPAGRGSLTERELELVTLTSSGHNVAETAVLLGISPLTVENLKRRVYAKLGVNSSAQAVARATSLGLLDQRTRKPAKRRTVSSNDFPVLTVVAGRPAPAREQVVATLLASGLPFVLERGRQPLGDAHWAQWNRGPMLAVLVDPEPADWDLVTELGVPAIVVHSKPLDQPDLARALAGGASSLVPTDRIGDHFLSVLRMVSHGYLVVDSLPMRSLMGVVRPRLVQRITDSGELPELTARESDILRSAALGHSVRQTARALEISPKTVENTQTRLFRKLEVRNRAEALAVANELGLLAGTPPADGVPASGVPTPVSQVPAPVVAWLPGLARGHRIACGGCFGNRRAVGDFGGARAVRAVRGLGPGPGAQGHVAQHDPGRQEGDGQPQARVVAVDERLGRAGAGAQFGALPGPQHRADHRDAEQAGDFP